MKIDFSLDQSQRADAKRALRLIAGKNLTIEECVKIALAMDRGTSVTTTVETAVEEFLKSVLRRGKREGTYRFYYERLQWFTKQHDGTLDDWDRPTLQKALEKMPRSPTTIRMTYRAIRALFGWARRQDPMLCRGNPCTGMKLDLPDVARNVRFLTIDDVQKILVGLRPELRAAACLMFFAGIRPEEIAPRNKKPRLRWENVRASKKFVRVPGEVAKVTDVPRIIQGLPETLWNLLPRLFPEGKLPVDGDVCGFTADTLIRSMRDALGKPWIQDVTRHTFATYAMATESNAGKVSEWLGHEGELGTFHKHYKGLVEAEDAVKYWALDQSLFQR